MPVKSKYPPLTKEEKKIIIARHKDLVDKFNAILPEGQKVSYDKNLLQKLNDPDTVAVYRIANEMKQVAAQQDEIRANLEKKFGEYQGPINPFMRSLSCGFRLDNSKDAIDHNEQTYKDYLHDPNKLAYVRYKDVFKLNPQDILACKGSKTKLAEYYKKNFTAIKDAWEFANASRRMDLTPAMKDMEDSISDQLNLLGKIDKEIMVIGSSLDYFAYPKITRAQGDILSDNLHIFRQLEQATGIEKNETINAYITSSMEKEVGFDLFSNLETINEKGGHLGEGSLVKYKVVAKNKFNKHEKVVDVGKFFNDPENPNRNVDPNVDYTMKARSDEELKHIKLMNFKAAYIYANAWRTRFQARSNLGTFDPDRIESSLKLGRLSRWFGRGNSREYNRLMETYRQFNDPRHKNYLREDLLKEAATNYRDRKANQGHTGLGNSLDDRRMKFADDVIATCEQCKTDLNQIVRDIDSELLHGYPPKKEPFLEIEDVEEKEYEYKVDDKELNKEIDFSKDVKDISL